MLPLILLALFALGAIVASFVGVISERLHTGQHFLTGRSRCDLCDRPLPPLSLIPILSYLLSRGRSFCCGARISLRSPITETLHGALFALSYLALGMAPALLFFLTALSLLLALVLYDLSHQILPPSLLVAFIAASAVTRLLLLPSASEFALSCLVALLIASFLALIHFASRGRAMGLADAPLAFGLALLVGPFALTGFMFSFWIGAVIGILLLAGRPHGSRMGREVPFAPYLAAGFLLAYFTKWNILAFILGSP